MCPADVIVKTEALDDIVDLSSPACGDGVGAMAEKRAAERPSALPSPPPTPAKLRIKREDSDDILADLHRLFDGLDVNDSDDDSNSDSGSDTVPPSPRSKGLDFPPTKTYFCVRNRNYSYDEDQNVYLEHSNGTSTFIHWGQMTDSILDAYNPSFHIDGTPFHFDISGLFYSEQGVMYPVQTWQPQMGLHPFQQDLGSDFGFNAFGDAFQPNLSLGSAFNFQQIDQPTVTNGTFCDTTQSKPQPKAEEEHNNPNPLQGSLQGSVPWSPSSSTQSPIVSASSRASSEQPLITANFKAEYPLFQPGLPQLEPEQNLGWIAGVQLWKHETNEIQSARHAPAIDKMDRRRCPECSKVFRRPSSLEDHLNVHSGNKPHVCPFERCKTGFATKSNMKRHFATHRAGTLEEYAKCGKVGKSKSRTATYNAKSFHTQRFRLT